MFVNRLNQEKSFFKGFSTRFEGIAEAESMDEQSERQDTQIKESEGIQKQGTVTLELKEMKTDKAPNPNSEQSESEEDEGSGSEKNEEENKEADPDEEEKGTSEEEGESGEDSAKEENSQNEE